MSMKNSLRVHKYTKHHHREQTFQGNDLEKKVLVTVMVSLADLHGSIKVNVADTSSVPPARETAFLSTELQFT